jgi:hypothetical protein
MATMIAAAVAARIHHERCLGGCILARSCARSSTSARHIAQARRCSATSMCFTPST